VAKRINLATARVGDVLVLKNGHAATVTREAKSPLWSPDSRGSVRAVYHHPTDEGWDGHEGDWDADGTKHSKGSWPEGSDVFHVVPRIPGLTGPVGATRKG
jgi:hypothetical protein